MVTDAANMAVAGAIFLGAAGLTDSAVQVENDDRPRIVGMNPVDPGAREIGYSGQFCLAGQSARL
jgi:hypothetical protein